MVKALKINKERQAILIGGAVLLLFGLIYRFYPGIHGFFSISDEIAMKRGHVEKYSSAVRKKDHIDKELRNLNQLLNKMESRLIDGETPSLAAVKMQKILNDITQATDVKISTIQVIKASSPEENAYVRIPIKFSFNSDIQQLKKVIYQIESSPKLLLITDMNIELLRRSKEGEIRSTITVEGIMKEKNLAG